MKIYTFPWHRQLSTNINGAHFVFTPDFDEKKTKVTKFENVIDREAMAVTKMQCLSHSRAKFANCILKDPLILLTGGNIFNSKLNAETFLFDTFHGEWVTSRRRKV